MAYLLLAAAGGGAVAKPVPLLDTATIIYLIWVLFRLIGGLRAAGRPVLRPNTPAFR